MPTDAELLSPPPEEPSAADMLWARYAGDPKRGVPTLTSDINPVSRKLSDFEIWALTPYFPVVLDLLDVTIHHGFNPPKPPDAKINQETWERMLREAGDKLAAATMLSPSGSGADIYIPGKIKPLYTRWWLGVLGHELTHGAQLRLGMTPQQNMQATLKHGYQNNPIERMARHTQGIVMRDLYERARAFYFGNQRKK